jgi:hypothetical protein
LLRSRSAASTIRKSSRLGSAGETASLPLKRLSTKRLLIARDARSSKHSQGYVLVEDGLALCHGCDRHPEQKRTIAFA